MCMAHLGWGPVVTAFAACDIAAFWLRKRESGSAAPIMAMDLFKIRLFSLSAVTAICAFAVQGLLVVVLPFLLTFELGYTQTEVGFLITPWSAALVFMTLIAAPLSDRVAPGLLGAAGLAILAAGLASVATMPEPVGRPHGYRLAVPALRSGLRFLSVAKHGRADEQRTA